MQLIAPFLAALSVGVATATPLVQRSEDGSTEGSVGVQTFETPIGNWSTWNGGWTRGNAEGTAWVAVASKGGKVINNDKIFEAVSASVNIVLDPIGDDITNSDAGLLIRTTNPGLGQDKMDAYYGAISYNNGILIGKAKSDGPEGSWTSLSKDDSVRPVPGFTYTLTFEASGETLTATAKNDTHSFSTTVSDLSFTKGYSGLRVYNVGAKFTDYSSV